MKSWLAGMASLIVWTGLNASSVFAHMVWIVPEGERSSRASVVFADELTADRNYPDLMDKISNVKLWTRNAEGQDVPVSWEKGEAELSVRVAGQGMQMLGGTAIYGVSSSGKRLLVYHPKAVWGEQPAGMASSRWEKLEMEIIPVGSHGANRFQVLYRGAPAPNAEVSFLPPMDALDKYDAYIRNDTMLAGPDGVFTMEFHAAGYHGLRARHTVKVAGEYGGKAYEEIRHYATLVMNVPASRTTPLKAEGYPRRFTDAKGHTVVLSEKPRRIASLTLGTDENLLDLISTDRMVAMTAVSKMADISNVANRPTPKRVAMIEKDWEKIKDLKPDLVLVATYTRELADPLIAAGLPVYQFSEFEGMWTNRKNLITLGQLVGEEEKTARILRQNRQTLEKARDKKRPNPLRAVYFSEGRIAGKGTTPADVIRAAGLANAAAEFGLEGNVKATPTLIAHLNPDIILIGEDSKEAERETRALFAGPEYQAIAAAKAGKIYAIPGKHITTVSHNIVKAVTDVLAMAQP